MKNAISEKTMEMLESRDIKFVTAEKRRNYLVPEPNLTTNFFSGILLLIWDFQY